MEIFCTYGFGLGDSILGMLAESIHGVKNDTKKFGFLLQLHGLIVYKDLRVDVSLDEAAVNSVTVDFSAENLSSLSLRKSKRVGI